MHLNIQSYLRCTPKAVDSIARLQSELGVYAKRHPKYNNLVQFTYDTIESSSAELRVNPIVRECRGIILDESYNWRVVAHPFNRFYNAEEPCADLIDWNTAKVQEKVDGSLMIVYFYDGKWHVATKGSPDASGNVGTSTRVFNEYFWETFWNYSNTPNGAPNMFQGFTYMLEFTSPENRVVCDHPKASLTYLGCRWNDNGKEICATDSFSPNIPKVREFPIRSIEECMVAAKALNPMHQEGFVVVDGVFQRVKVKSPSYVAIHHIKDGFGKRRIIELIKNGEQSEVLAYFPEYMKIFREVQERIGTIIVEAEQRYEQIKHLPVGKEFALEAVHSSLPGALFALKRGKASSIREFVLGMSTEKLADLV